MLQTVRKAFEGTGEVEDGAVELEDIIIVIASCIDHVSYKILLEVVHEADVAGTDIGIPVVFTESAGDET